MSSRAINICLTLTFIAATLVLTFMMDRSDTPYAEKPEMQAASAKLQPAPDAIFTDLSGNKIRLADYKGRVILLNFWASWCAPCVHEFPQFVNLARNMGDKIVIIAVSTDDDRSKIEAFLKKVDFAPSSNMMIAWDRDKSLSQDVFGTVVLPETIIIDPQLRMADKVPGNPIAWDGPEMAARLEAIFSR